MLIDQSDVHGFSKLLNTRKVQQGICNIGLRNLLHHLHARISLSLLHTRFFGHVVINFQQVTQFWLKGQRLEGLSGLLLSGILDDSHPPGLDFTTHDPGFDVQGLNFTVFGAD